MCILDHHNMICGPKSKKKSPSSSKVSIFLLYLLRTHGAHHSFFAGARSVSVELKLSVQRCKFMTVVKCTRQPAKIIQIQKKNRKPSPATIIILLHLHLGMKLSLALILLNQSIKPIS